MVMSINIVWQYTNVSPLEYWAWPIVEGNGSEDLVNRAVANLGKDDVCLQLAIL